MQRLDVNEDNISNVAGLLDELRKAGPNSVCIFILSTWIITGFDFIDILRLLNINNFYNELL